MRGGVMKEGLFIFLSCSWIVLFFTIAMVVPYWFSSFLIRNNLLY